MWKFTGKNQHGDASEPLPGLPLEASDSEFAAAAQALGHDLAALKASGLYAQSKAPAAAAPVEEA